MDRLALIGASGHANDVLGLVESRRRSGAAIEAVGLFHSDPESIDARRFADRGVDIRPLAELADLDPDSVRYIAAVGYPSARADVAALPALTAFEPATVLHDTAEIGTGATLGAGVVVLAHTVVSPMTRLGDHVMVGNGAIVGHDTIVGAFTSLMPASCVSGDCTIGERVLIGTNATVLEKVSIGDDAVIGAGAVVTADVEPGTTVVGIPARVLGR